MTPRGRVRTLPQIIWSSPDAEGANLPAKLSGPANREGKTPLESGTPDGLAAVLIPADGASESDITSGA